MEPTQGYMGPSEVDSRLTSSNLLNPSIIQSCPVYIHQLVEYTSGDRYTRHPVHYFIFLCKANCWKVLTVELISASCNYTHWYYNSIHISTFCLHNIFSQLNALLKQKYIMCILHFENVRGQSVFQSVNMGSLPLHESNKHMLSFGDCHAFFLYL